MTSKKYVLTEEHKAMLPAWRDKWIANAMSTTAMTDDDRQKCREAVAGMYAAANLPPPKHVVFVPSPFVAAFAGGFAAAIWYNYHKPADNDTTYKAARKFIREATFDATLDVILRATYKATVDVASEAASEAAFDATFYATREATLDATNSATNDATREATFGVTHDATLDAAGDTAYKAARKFIREAAFDATIYNIHRTTYRATADATRKSVREATSDATLDVTHRTTYRATVDATREATRNATNRTTYRETFDATRKATRKVASDTTYKATIDATIDDIRDLSRWYVYNENISETAERLGVGEFGLACAARYYSMWQGGNQWSAYDSFLSFFQDVAKLDVDYSAYNHWRILAECSGPRIVHADFCIISDRPEILTVDEENRPHNENGPYCRWRDGSELYSYKGVLIPANWVVNKATVNPAEIINHPNVDARAAGAELVGWARMLDVLQCKIIDDSGSDDIGQLIELKLPGLDKPGLFLKARCPRNGWICEGVPFISDIDNLPIKTALHAQAWRIGDPLSEYQHTPMRT
jgi:hypothetical protein